ncbi:hypothetical protein LSH36_736g00015 [Paralvinella palmiformis]|uniref:Spermatogenesis-associated protein 4 n=1 Tax=Paralvinella palmiformis TaxID=53620 RepID=A0AAD9MT11_9ANNE|nr:hypothetical protein LSH36_736g00015 [Paralvinella palmiformis]
MFLKMSGLSRDVLKWLQSLDLTWPVKTPKWDLSNGYLIAEIFSWYFPQVVEMHMYNNGNSLESKLKNWFLLKNFIKRHRLEIPEEFVEGTIHCKEGAGQLLVERIYEILTNREAIRSVYQPEIDFTDHAYQMQLPIHARSTATQAVKSNLKITELMADQNLILGQQKAQIIINDHREYRRQQRVEDPERFSLKPTLGELAVRKEPSPEHEQTEDGEEPENKNTEESSKIPERTEKEEQDNEIPYKEIAVQQLSKNDTPKIPGY